MNLLEKTASYLIITAQSSDKTAYDNMIGNRKLENLLYVKDYTLFNLNSNDNNICYYAYKNCTNKELRYDAIELMYEFKQEFVYVKYIGECDIKKIYHDGIEKIYTLDNYQGLNESTSFFHDGYTFSFKEKKRYITPTKKDLTEGVIYEYKNNNGVWIERKVIDPTIEYAKMFELLIKYNKIRISY